MTRHVHYDSPSRAGPAEVKGSKEHNNNGSVYYDKTATVGTTQGKADRCSANENNPGNSTSPYNSNALASINTANTSTSGSEKFTNNNVNLGKASVAAAESATKYRLRPRSSSLSFQHNSDDQDFITECAPRTRPGHKPRLLSRYRRKTANARERGRMRQINTAFETLRGVLPDGNFQSKASASLTKISTLKLAAAYIRTLQDILDNGTDEKNNCESTGPSYSWLLASLLQENQQEDMKSDNIQVVKKFRPNSPWLEQLLDPELNAMKSSPPSSPWLGHFLQPEQSPYLKSEFPPHSITSNGSFLYDDTYSLDFESLPCLSPTAETNALSLLLESKTPQSLQSCDTVLV